jgi:hypothetical protein
MRDNNSLSNLFLFLIAFLLVIGCDQTFEPLQENDKYHFSIFGYLDVSADTQWVRVSPARQQLNLPPEVPEMRVTLEHLESGETVVMNDSLFSRTSGFNYINFYTNMDIEPGETYKVKAERPDGRSSNVTISTPDNFPTPLFYIDTRGSIDGRIYQIIIRGANKITDVQTWWFVRVKSDEGVVEKKFIFSYANRLQWISAYGGAFLVEFIFEEEVAAVMNSSLIRLAPDAEVEILHRQVYVANGGPEWNTEIPSLDDLIYTQLVISNVQNGVGYMVGVYSKVIPYKTCRDNTGWIIACEEEEPFW